MLAIILVGGLGTRLRPLTDRCPKPLVPVAGTPFMTRRLLRLQREGISEAVLAVQYKAERFRTEYAGSPFETLRVAISEEPQPLGTAGAARFAVEDRLATLTEPVFVLNGDLLTDLDLQAMLAFHRRTGAVATIAVAEVEDTRAYGVVAADQSGRVVAFQEKPAPGSELARTVNTGVYLLNPAALARIPAGRSSMVERDLFPELVAAGEAVYAFRHQSRWIDIGTPAGYLAANEAVLAGTLAGEQLPGEQVRPGVWAGPGVVIDQSAVLEGPIVLGTNVFVGPETRLKGPLAVGARSQLGAGACVSRSIVWSDVAVPPGAVVSQSILSVSPPDERPLQAAVL